MENVVTKADVTPAIEREGGPRCQNCGADVIGPYCYQCGQRYASHVAPLRQLVAEALDTVFNLDNRLWRTFKVLAFRPGQLTQAYIDGKRASYVSPLRLYLIFSVLYFFIAALVDPVNFLFFKTADWGDASETLTQTLPRMMFVIIPGFALLLKGLYGRQQRLFAEHLIFSLHVHALWYVLFSVAAVLDPWVNQALVDGDYTVLSIAAVVINIPVQLSIPTYLFIAMRRMYGQARGKTFAKLVLLFVGYFGILLGSSLVVIALVRSMAGL